MSECCQVNEQSDNGSILFEWIKFCCHATTIVLCFAIETFEATTSLTNAAPYMQTVLKTNMES